MVSVCETGNLDAVHAVDRFECPLVAAVISSIHQFLELGLDGHPPFVAQFHVGGIVFRVQLDFVVDRSGRCFIIVFFQRLFVITPFIGAPVIDFLGLRLAPGVVIAGLRGLGGAQVEGGPLDRKTQVDGGGGGDVISPEGKPGVLSGDGAEAGAADGDGLVQRDFGKRAVQFGVGNVQSLRERAWKEGGEVVLPGDESAFRGGHRHRG